MSIKEENKMKSKMASFFIEDNVVNEVNEALKNKVRGKKTKITFSLAIKSFILLQFLVTAVLAIQGNSQCEDNYKSKNISGGEVKLVGKSKSDSKIEASEDKPFVSLIDRLNQFFEENPNSTPILLMDHFLNEELATVTSEYKAQVDLFSSVGVNSKLQSKAKVLEAALGKAERLLSELEIIADSEISIQKANESRTGWRRMFRKKSQFEKESEGDTQFNQLNAKISSFKSCKVGVDKCSLELKEAIDEAGENLVKIDLLKEKLNDFSLSLEELKRTIQSTKVRNNDDKLFLEQIIQQKIDSIVNKTNNLKKASQLEKTRIITALATINSILPLFEERIEIMLAKFADKEAVKNWEKEPDNAPHEIQVESYSSTMMKNIVNGDSDTAKFEIIRSLSEGAAAKNKKIFDVSDAIKILQSFSGEKASLQSVSLKLSLGDRDIFGKQYIYFGKMPLLPMVVVYLADLTEPGTNESSKASFYSTAINMAFLNPQDNYNIIYSATQSSYSWEKETETKNHIELLTGLIHKTLRPFAPGNN